MLSHIYDECESVARLSIFVGLSLDENKGLTVLRRWTTKSNVMMLWQNCNSLGLRQLVT
jgi:hypothetical protein